MEELSLSGENLYDLMNSFFKEGCDCSMKIQCKGNSMAPFLRNKNIVTIDPLNRKFSPKKGDIVAVAVHAKKRIMVHRIIRTDPPRYLIKGDNNTQSDGWFQANDILGIIHKIETTTGCGYTPKRWQNIIISMGSRFNILKHAFLPGLKFLKEVR